MKPMLSVGLPSLKKLCHVSQTKWVDLLQYLRALIHFIWRSSCITRMPLTLSGFSTPSITGREEVLCVRFQGNLRWKHAPSNQPQNRKCRDYVRTEPPQDLVAVRKWWVVLWLQTKQLLIFLSFQYYSVISTILGVCSVSDVKDRTICVVLMGM